MDNQEFPMLNDAKTKIPSSGPKGVTFKAPDYLHAKDMGMILD